MAVRNLILVLGDQLTFSSPALEAADKANDRIVMAEASTEATYIPQHKQRLVLFFSAMRHFREALKSDGFQVDYSTLEDDRNTGTIAGELDRRIKTYKPEAVRCLHPGDYRVKSSIEEACSKAGTRLDIVEDTHFLSTLGEFRRHQQGRSLLIMEYFYREMRKKTGLLMNDGEPVGGAWNFDEKNRQSFGKSGPPDIRAPRSFRTDAITSGVIKLVEKHFSSAPGSLEAFDYPVTEKQARQALGDFITHRLENFGRYQDAMASGRPYLFHSRLSPALNLHMLDPRQCIEAAMAAYDDGKAPLNSVEGFVRQILGWREYVRGIYWTRMPGYAELNALDADLPMPAFMWTAETEMACIRASVEQLIGHAYAHHIQRLMVLGLFAQLLGVNPYDVHRWHMSMYIDAIDWVSLPNVLGMSQYGDGGIVATKPYVASGNYINKMSDYCASCRFNPAKASGDDACPFTTLYWDFLSRNRNKLKGNRRMGFQFKNLDRKDDGERRDIRKRADTLKTRLIEKTYLS